MHDRSINNLRTAWYLFYKSLYGYFTDHRVCKLETNWSVSYISLCVHFTDYFVCILQTAWRVLENDSKYHHIWHFVVCGCFSHRRVCIHRMCFHDSPSRTCGRCWVSMTISASSVLFWILYFDIFFPISPFFLKLNLHNNLKSLYSQNFK